MAIIHSPLDAEWMFGVLYVMIVVSAQGKMTNIVRSARFHELTIQLSPMLYIRDV